MGGIWEGFRPIRDVFLEVLGEDKDSLTRWDWRTLMGV